MISKRQMANLLKRWPLPGVIAQRIYRIIQPKVSVGAIGAVFNEHGQVLVVEHVFHPVFPWGLPGGWVEANESPDDAVRRELHEETGLTIEIVKPLLVLHAPYLPKHLDIAYLCTIAPDSDPIKLSGELLDYRWIDPTKPIALTGFHMRTLKAAINERKLLVPAQE
jgi:ADP-ribose pyrophosphatase YjhB (NUDIX family)